MPRSNLLWCNDSSQRRDHVFTKEVRKRENDQTQKKRVIKRKSGRKRIIESHKKVWSNEKVPHDVLNLLHSKQMDLFYDYFLPKKNKANDFFAPSYRHSWFLRIRHGTEVSKIRQVCNVLNELNVLSYRMPHLQITLKRQ